MKKRKRKRKEGRGKGGSVGSQGCPGLRGWMRSWRLSQGGENDGEGQGEAVREERISIKKARVTDGRNDNVGHTVRETLFVSSLWGYR